MKKLFFALFAIGAILAFSACSSDDDEKEQKFFTGDCKQTISLKAGPANASITLGAVESTLENMLKDSQGYGSPISTGELEVTGSNTSVRVVGLPEGVSLKDFKIKINDSNIEQNFGEISIEKANLNLYTSAYTNFFSSVFNKMVSDKKLKTVVSFVPSHDITEDVKLEITFSGRFSYWVKL